MTPYIPLDRRFRDLSPREIEQPSELEESATEDSHNTSGWDDILRYRRVLLLAEAGSGKSAEMRAQERLLTAQNRPAFYLPLEDLAEHRLPDVLDPPARGSFERWLADRQAIGYFFLDAADELKLHSHIHGRPCLPSNQSCNGKQIEIAAIHPDFCCGDAAVPDGMRWQVPDQPHELFAPCVK